MGQILDLHRLSFFKRLQKRLNRSLNLKIDEQEAMSIIEVEKHQVASVFAARTSWPLMLSNDLILLTPRPRNLAAKNATALLLLALLHCLLSMASPSFDIHLHYHCHTRRRAAPPCVVANNKHNAAGNPSTSPYRPTYHTLFPKCGQRASRCRHLLSTSMPIRDNLVLDPSRRARRSLVRLSFSNLAVHVAAVPSL